MSLLASTEIPLSKTKGDLELLNLIINMDIEKRNNKNKIFMILLFINIFMNNYIFEFACIDFIYTSIE